MLKRLLRYLAGRPRAGVVYEWQSPCSALVSQVDSDWAGCSRTRRSTSGGVLLRGQHVLGHWSRTQAAIALSSGETELNAALKGAVELLGLRTLLGEFGVEGSLTIEGDSAAAKGTLSREGSGRIKHLEVRQLWLQTHVKNGDVRIVKIPREINPADALTKHWSPTDSIKHSTRLKYQCFPSLCSRKADLG